jgi:hypothetical protein
MTEAECVTCAVRTGYMQNSCQFSCSTGLGICVTYYHWNVNIDVRTPGRPVRRTEQNMGSPTWGRGLDSRKRREVLRFYALFAKGLITYLIVPWLLIQGDTGWKFGIFGGDSIVHCEKKVIWTCVLIVNGYRDRAVWISRHNAVTFLFLGLGEERSLHKERRVHETNCSLAFWMLLPA